MQISISQKRSRDGSIKGEIDLGAMLDAVKKNSISELIAAVVSVPDWILSVDEKSLFIDGIINRESSCIYVHTNYVDTNSFWTNSINIDENHTMNSYCKEYDD